MSALKSYRDVLREHAPGHHVAWSPWLAALAIAVLVIALAEHDRRTARAGLEFGIQDLAAQTDVD